MAYANASVIRRVANKCTRGGKTHLELALCWVEFRLGLAYHFLFYDFSNDGCDGDASLAIGGLGRFVLFMDRCYDSELEVVWYFSCSYNSVCQEAEHLLEFW